MFEGENHQVVFLHPGGGSQWLSAYSNKRRHVCWGLFLKQSILASDPASALLFLIRLFLDYIHILSCCSLRSCSWVCSSFVLPTHSQPLEPCHLCSYGCGVVRGSTWLFPSSTAYLACSSGPSNWVAVVKVLCCMSAARWPPAPSALLCALCFRDADELLLFYDIYSYNFFTSCK